MASLVRVSKQVEYERQRKICSHGSVKEHQHTAKEKESPLKLDVRLVAHFLDG